MPESTLIPKLRAALETARMQVRAEVEYIEPHLEGWRDQLKLVKPTTKEKVVEPAIRDYQRRLDRVNDVNLAIGKTLEMLAALENDGHPNFPKRVTTAEEREDLADQKRTIDLTIEDIEVEQASDLNPALGAPEPRSP